MRQILLVTLLTLSSILAEEDQPLSEEEYNTLKLNVQNDLGAKLEAQADGTKYEYGDAHELIQNALLEVADNYSKPLRRVAEKLEENSQFGRLVKEIHSFCRVRIALARMLQGRKAKPGRFGGDEVCAELREEGFNEDDFLREFSQKSEVLKATENEFDLGKFAVDLFKFLDDQVIVDAEKDISEAVKSGLHKDGSSQDEEHTTGVYK